MGCVKLVPFTWRKKYAPLPPRVLGYQNEYCDLIVTGAQVLVYIFQWVNLQFYTQPAEDARRYTSFKFNAARSAHVPDN